MLQHLRQRRFGHYALANICTGFVCRRCSPNDLCQKGNQIFQFLGK